MHFTPTPRLIRAPFQLSLIKNWRQDLPKSLMKSFSKTHLSFRQLYGANFQGILTFLRENQAMVYDFINM